MNWPESPFWDYAVSLYQRRGVEIACLDLQRRQGLDVNLLLFACWLASLGILLDRTTLERAKNAVLPWQTEMVRPLRALRDRLKRQIDRAAIDDPIARWPDLMRKLRKDVLAIELDSEHLAQLALTEIAADLKPSRTPCLELAACNIALYWSPQSVGLDDLRVLLRQAFPAASDEELALALSRFET